MHVELVGEGPAAAAITAALSDCEGATVETAEAGTLADADLGAVVGPAGDDRFEKVAAARWVAVEVGGVGGHPLSGVDAAVSVFDGDGPADPRFSDLRGRVASTVDVPAAAPDADAAAVRLAGAVAGRRAVGLAEGDSLGGTLVEVSGTTVGSVREFLPLPLPEGSTGGPGADRDRRPPRDHREVPLEDALGRMERTLDDRVGAVVEVGERESFPLPYYIAATADTTAYSDARAAQFAAGVDPGWDTAFAKALGEALERYSAGVYRTAAFTMAPARARARPVTPDAFVRPDGWATPGPDDPLAWVGGVDLATDEAVSLPAELVHYPPPTEQLRPAITTGLGLGNSGVEALLAGLYETIERDATMLAWYSTYEPLALAVDDGDYRTLVGRARAEGLSATALLVTQDVDVPVVAAAVHREGEWPRFAAGSAADLDAAAAARSALAEALQNWMELRAMGPEAAAAEEGAIGRYADLPDAAREFLDAPATVPAADVGPDEVPRGRAELDAVVDRVTDAGLAGYASRLTPRDVDALGFEAVRVLVPAAQPLFVGDPFFGDRARTVPGELGFEPRLDRDFHPFP
jgi:ribosomal protein S12 methylthiotransferase accessory factor